MVRLTGLGLFSSLCLVIPHGDGVMPGDNNRIKVGPRMSAALL